MFLTSQNTTVIKSRNIIAYLVFNVFPAQSDVKFMRSCFVSKIVLLSLDYSLPSCETSFGVICCVLLFVGLCFVVIKIVKTIINVGLTC